MDNAENENYSILTSDGSKKIKLPATILFYKYHDNILQNKQANMIYFYNEKIKCIHIYLFIEHKSYDH